VKSTGKLVITAKRTATQIDFLSRRHQSREAENIRCVDDEQKQRHNFPIAIVLDNLRSAANVGSIFRSADAAGCSEVVTSEY
jgi:tRNA G18 (ribose-2'-O)-methylase SpoU